MRILPRETSRLPFVLSLSLSAFFVWAAAPEITWFDTGELAGAGFALGISHPPGQPLHTLAAKLFTFIPLGTIGFRCNLLSAVSAGLSILYLGKLANTLWPDKNGKPVLVCVAVMALSWALTEQSVRTEVYTLSLLFVLLAYWSISPHFSTQTLLDKGDLATTLKLSEEARKRRPADSLAPRRTIRVYAMTRLPVRRPVVIAGFSLSLAAAAHPLIAFAAGLALGFAALIPVFKRRSFSSVAWGMGGVMLGSFLWLYLPIVAHRETPVHMGDPSSIEGFLFMITGRAYAENLGAPASGFLPRLLDLLKVFSYVSGPFVLIAAAIALLLCWSKKIGGRLSIFLPFSLLFSTVIPLITVGSFLPHNPDLRGYMLPALCALALLAAWTAVKFPQKAFNRSRLNSTTQAVLVSALLAPLALTHFGRLSEETARGAEAHEMTLRVSKAVMPGPALVSAGSDHFLFPLLYAKAAEDWRPDIAVSNSWMIGSTAHWYRHLVKKQWPWLFVPLVDDGGNTKQIRRRFISINAERFQVYVESPLEPKPPLNVEDCGIVYGVVPNDKTHSIASGSETSGLFHSENKICASYEEFPLIREPESGRMVHCNVAVSRARFLAGRGEYDKALQQLKPHLANPPPPRWKNAGSFLCTTSEPFVLSARIHMKEKRYVQAAVHLEYAVRNEPERLENLIAMGRLKAMQNRLDSAAVWFERALKIDHDNVHALFYMAMIKGRMGAVDEATALMKRAERTDPDTFRKLLRAHRRKDRPQKESVQKK